ncbi:uncharacterized protein LOC105833606 isoform X2 [Monomorium pharaonis]|uniref:uncharacterized protein LOC105833606 isoform X2 n=1 Tax=Monomorium pharaonis TaxID=307658 RepID=UPI00102E11BA|nr:uncharacterized protein LOC105833606 isoform X2 [Monomorium pharaonis]
MEIQTFVFFDLETTGLIREKDMPKITEIALIAVSRESICNCNGNSLPRILQKLVIPVNPQKIIPPNVEHMTKLYNENMQLLQPFESGLYELIMHFLQRLTPPICFAAHNGDKFDYPIFLGELEQINKILNNEILCIDTLKMFQNFFMKRELEPKVIQDLLNDEYNDSLSTLDIDVNMDIETLEESSIVATMSTAQTAFPWDNKYNVMVNGKVKEYKNHVDAQSSRNPIQTANEKTPKNQIMKLENVFPQRPSKKNNPKKKLKFECEKPISLKLPDIYGYMFNSDFSHHSAEADCLAMIRCAINIAHFFLDWSDNHARPLICCKKT